MKVGNLNIDLKYADKGNRYYIDDISIDVYYAEVEGIIFKAVIFHGEEDNDEPQIAQTIDYSGLIFSNFPNQILKKGSFEDSIQKGFNNLYEKFSYIYKKLSW